MGLHLRQYAQDPHETLNEKWRTEMSDNLTTEELVALIERVFRPKKEDKGIAILVDLPDQKVADNPGWRARRELAFEWYKNLRRANDRLSLPVNLILVRNAHRNNAQLPSSAWYYQEEVLPDKAEDLDPNQATDFAALFVDNRIWIAPTEFSATAPLKLAARETGIRAATMPGFKTSMIPALRLDYGQINQRVHIMTQLLNQAQQASLVFRVDGKQDYSLTLDLRHRQAHSSGGLFPNAGVAGNLPSGESYIVPYEGEHDSQPSLSNGQLPVQFGEEVVVYTIEKNRAIKVSGENGPALSEEQLRLQQEPAYGNIAELGLGVLSDFGLKPTGETLLDEKLALHIAFGRSDHFGGQVGPGDFSSADAVVHIDRVYLKEIQPRIVVHSAVLTNEDNSRIEIMHDGRYTIDFNA